MFMYFFAVFFKNNIQTVAITIEVHTSYVSDGRFVGLTFFMLHYIPACKLHTSNIFLHGLPLITAVGFCLFLHDV